MDMLSSAESRGKPASLLSPARLISLLTAILVSMASGSNYVFSAYGPQLGARLHLTHTQLSVVGLSGTVGVYGTAPLLGRLVDAKGPPIPLTIAFFALLTGYSGLRRFYILGLPDETTSISFPSFLVLLLFGLFTGIGANGGMASAINATAKSFPDHARTTTTSLVLSGFGLSAFVFSTIAHVAFPGNTSSFLLVLAIGTSLPMVLGIFFVKPIPLPPVHHDSEGSIDRHFQGQCQSGEEVPHAISRIETDARVPLLSSRDVDDANSSVYDRSKKDPSVSLPDISGMGLAVSVEFWLLAIITTLLSGTALMYINNVGTISQALYAKAASRYDEVEAAQWQATQVSTISISNCLGRIIIGLLADSSKRFFGIRRPVFISLIATAFIISQLTTFYTSEIEQLWKASALLGLSYGSSVALFPSITIDWFGLAHFSENWGFVSLAPVVGGNIFSIAFGRILDAHSSVSSNFSPGGHDGGDGRCLDGRSCYNESFKLTTSACCLALVLGLYAAFRDLKKAKGTNTSSEDERMESTAWIE